MNRSLRLTPPIADSGSHRPRRHSTALQALGRSLALAPLLCGALPLVAQGPVQISTFARGPNASGIALGQQFLFFNNQPPWVHDGTAAGYRQVVPSTVVQWGGGALTHDGVAYFSGTDPATRQLELWRTDGTATGTYLVLDILARSSSAASPKAVLNGRILFNASLSAAQRPLFITDGTAAGTIQIGPEAMGIDGPDVVVHRGVAYFVSPNAQGHRQLWKTDGTAAGTALVHDVFPGGNASPNYLTAHTDGVYFTADDGTSGSELWKTDGSSAGTQRVVDIRPGVYGSGPRGTVSAGGLLFFGANDGLTGTELWCSDGTASGTLRLTDVLPASLDPRQLTEFGGRCVFGGNTPAEGWELWISDGTTAGTGILKDIQPGSGSSIQPSAGDPAFTVVGDRLYVGADDGVQGGLLWVSDGTTAGTHAAFAPLPGTLGSGGDVNVVNGKITFTATTTSFRGALYAWDEPATVQVVGSGCGPAARTPTIDSTGPRVGANWRVRGAEAFPGSIAVLAVSTPAAAPITLPLTSCSLYVDPLGLIVTPAFPIADGTWLMDFAIPNDPGLSGLLLVWQAIFIGTDNPHGGVDTSPGLAMGIGV